jgi:hypothetical protein
MKEEQKPNGHHALEKEQKPNGHHALEKELHQELIRHGVAKPKALASCPSCYVSRRSFHCINPNEHIISDEYLIYDVKSN